MLHYLRQAGNVYAPAAGTNQSWIFLECISYPTIKDLRSSFLARATDPSSEIQMVVLVSNCDHQGFEIFGWLRARPPNQAKLRFVV